jgi:hypothetical protein
MGPSRPFLRPESLGAPNWERHRTSFAPHRRAGRPTAQLSLQFPDNSTKPTTTEGSGGARKIRNFSTFDQHADDSPAYYWH